MSMNFCIIVPAHNEVSLIGPCLSALIEGHDQFLDIQVEIIVVANACKDETAKMALELNDAAHDSGIVLSVIETPIGGKAHALNLAEQNCDADIRAYLDADVICGPGMIEALAAVLTGRDARYASGQIIPSSNGSFFSWCYGQVWKNLPFVKSDVAGCGLYAVNATGRKRWNAFPQIHSDDKFVRLHFTPDERFKVDVEYLWPLPKNLWELIKVRSRWCRGNSELARDFQHLLANDQSQKIKPLWALGFVMRHPLSSLVFTTVYVAAKLRALIYSNSATALWERSR